MHIQASPDLLLMCVVRLADMLKANNPLKHEQELRDQLGARMSSSNTAYQLMEELARGEEWPKNTISLLLSASVSLEKQRSQEIKSSQMEEKSEDDDASTNKIGILGILQRLQEHILFRAGRKVPGAAIESTQQTAEFDLLIYYAQQVLDR